MLEKNFLFIWVIVIKGGDTTYQLFSLAKLNPLERTKPFCDFRVNLLDYLHPIQWPPCTPFRLNLYKGALQESNKLYVSRIVLFDPLPITSRNIILRRTIQEVGFKLSNDIAHEITAIVDFTQNIFLEEPPPGYDYDYIEIPSRRLKILGLVDCPNPTPNFQVIRPTLKSTIKVILSFNPINPIRFFPVANSPKILEPI